MDAAPLVSVFVFGLHMKLGMTVLRRNVFDATFSLETEVPSEGLPAEVRCQMVIVVTDAPVGKVDRGAVVTTGPNAHLQHPLPSSRRVHVHPDAVPLPVLSYQEWRRYLGVHFVRLLHDRDRHSRKVWRRSLEPEVEEISCGVGSN